MLLKLFRANYFYNFILFPLVGVLLLLGSFVSGGTFPVYAGADTTPICQLIYQSGLSYTGAIVLNFVFVLIICLLLLHINAKFDFVKERTFLPVYLFLFVVYALPELHVIRPIFLSAIFILLSIRSIFLSFEKRTAINNAFDAGFLIGIAGIFYLSANLLIILIPFSIFILRNKIEWREVVLPFFGLLIPWLLLFCYYFIWHDVSQLYELIGHSISNLNESVLSRPLVQTYLAFLLLITLLASLFILTQYGEKNISTRRYFKILSLYFYSSLLLIFIPSVSYEIIVILAIPLTFLITNYLIFMRRRFWAELFFIGLVLFSIVLQIFR
jgi:hypothetical protein